MCLQMLCIILMGGSIARADLMISITSPDLDVAYLGGAAVTSQDVHGVGWSTATAYKDVSISAWLNYVGHPPNLCVPHDSHRTRYDREKRDCITHVCGAQQHRARLGIYRLPDL